MKRGFSILLMLIYVVLATDMSVAIHKCMGSVQSVSLIQGGETCCCGDFNADGCCENSTVEFPEEPENKLLSSFQFSFEKSILKTLVVVPAFDIAESLAELEYEFVFHDLPPPNPEAAYILHCSLTYYG